MAVKVYKPEYPGLYYFDTFTFTTLGASGNRGPDSTKAYANAPWRDGDFSIVDGQQQWTVPATGTYNIVAAGAYGATPGRVVSGDIDLSEGQTLTMLVGQQPTPLTANVADNVTVGGGGGTFVVSGGVPLIVASGGDGGVYSTGYLRSELVTENFQFRVSMSADGNVYAAIEISLITFQFALKIYRYLSGVWTPEFTAPSIFTGVVLSGNGKTVAVPTSNSITVYEYVDQIWDNPRYITNNEWNYVSITIQISYDGNTIVAFTSNIISNIYFHLYVCTKNQDLTWNTEELSAPGNDTFTVYNANSCAISIDGTRIFAAADDIYSFPTVSNLWSYSRTNNTWGLPELYSTPGVVRIESTSVSYDGQFVAIYVGNLQVEPREGYLYVYENGNLIRNLTFPWTVQQFPAGAVQISYDGSLALLIFITGKILVTPSTQITIFDDASGFPLPSGCIDSTASRIVSPYYDVANPITYFFEAGGSGQPGSFLPSGTGSGISGAGYLTDGQQTDPFFGFLKPKAYVNGGFGNSYEYGQPGVPKEGGFGGGQSPLNKQTDLTSVSGYKQFRPTIPLVSGALTGMAISEDANTFLASFFLGSSGTAYTNVYTYNGTSWVSTNLYTTTTGGGNSLAVSGDGVVWLINADVWRNGSFEIQLQVFAQYGVGFDVTDISRDGNTAVIMYAQMGGVDTTVRLIVYSYSGSWTSITLFSQDPDPDFALFTCAMSADGNTIAMSYSVTTYVFVNVYRRVDGTWSDPDQISYQNLTSRNPVTLHVNSDGSIITLSVGSSGSYQYSNGVLSKVDYGTYSGAFSRTDPNLYAWSYFSTVHVPSISLEIVVQVDPAGIDVMRMGSNVLAMSKNLTPHAIVFLDMYDPTTTCTASTSIDHGYPYDYEVQITGTQYFNGTWLITAGSSNTFTFQAFGGPTVTSGYVSGTTTGISGGGGYTGSAGNGVSGATCYADESVVNFTDLGATSNSAGYVTVTLVDPAPITFDAKAINPVIKKFYSNRNLRSIIWSPEFGKYFAVSSSVVNPAVSIVVYSTDLEAWTGTESPQGCQSVCWSPKLKLFTTGKAVSAECLTWTLGDSTKNFYQIVWCDFMNSFFAWIPNTIDHFLDSTYTYKSVDGLNWVEMTDGPLVQHGYLGYLSSVSVGAQSLVFITGGVVYTYDGTTWTSHQSNAVRSVYYDNQFVLFLNYSTCYTSLDGVIWYYKSSFPFDPTSIQDCTVFENTLYVCSSMADYYYGSYNRFYSSQDLLTWTRIDTIGSEVTKPDTYIKTVVNVNSILLASTNKGKTLASVDFRIWAPLTTSLFRGSEIYWATLCFSPETGYLVASGNTNPEGKTVIYYSNDAVIWNSVTLDTVIHDVNSASWMPEIGKFIFNGYYLVDPLNNWEVSTISSRPNPGYGNQWYPIGKVLICQNGDQTNDAYNWRNDPNVTVYVGYGTSGGWLYPSTMMAISSYIFNTTYIRTSTDAGKTWITTNYQAVGATFGTSGTLCIVHSPPPYVQYSIMTSTDGITWTPGINPGNFFFCYGIFWISSIKMFAAVFSPGYDGNFSVVSLTSDGNNWSTIYSFESALRAATWCENLNTLVIIGYSGDYTLNITF